MNPTGGATDPARTLKSDVVSELEAISHASLPVQVYTPCTDTEVGAQRPHPLPRCVSECYTLAHLIPRYPPHVHTGTWGTLETFTPAVRANKVCTARRAKRTASALVPPAKKPTSTQNTTLQTMGMDVIKQYPGPLTVSRAVKR